MYIHMYPFSFRSELCYSHTRIYVHTLTRPLALSIFRHPPSLPPHTQAENDPLLYGLYVVYDSGAQDPVSEKQCPLMVRLRLGPSEDIAKLYIMEKSDARAAQISAEV